MTGESLKMKLFSCGYRVSDLAELLDMSQQNVSRALAVADVKTGFIEKLSSVLNKDICFFFASENSKPEPQQSQSVPYFMYNDLQDRLESVVRENQSLRERLAQYEDVPLGKRVAQS